MNPIVVLYQIHHRLGAPLRRLFETAKPRGLQPLELFFEEGASTLIVRFDSFDASRVHRELEVRTRRSVVQRVAFSRQGRQHVARVRLDVLEEGLYELFTRDERNRRYRLYDSSRPNRGKKLPHESARSSDGERRASLLRTPLGPYLRLMIGTPESAGTASSAATLLHTSTQGTRLTLRGVVTTFGELDEATSPTLVAQTPGSSSAVPVGEIRMSPRRIIEGRESFSFRAVIDIEELRSKNLFSERNSHLKLALPMRDGTSLLLPIRARRIGPFRKSFGEILHRFRRTDRKAGVVVRLTRPGSIVISLRTPPAEENLAFKLKELAAFFLHLAMLRRRRKTWILFEALSSTAQDNAYVFFKWLLENNRTENVPYYIIRRDSPQFDKLSPFRENVIEHGSFRHLFEVLACRALISSQGREHAYSPFKV